MCVQIDQIENRSKDTKLKCMRCWLPIPAFGLLALLMAACRPTSAWEPAAAFAHFETDYFTKPQNEFFISPNPSSVYTTVTTSNVINSGSYIIRNSLGEAVQNDFFQHQNSVQIYFDHLSPGVYFIRVILNDNKIYTRKFIKK